ncbi:MAG: hypothetical protein ASARMPREDX12_004727 [Alectoria sarmentosa]|nr:MAG: hypothetical protein ASARMPREDX12_004727 [Alectoria sarmentosa]
MLIVEVKWPIRHYRMCYDLALFLMVGNPEPDFPADYKAPEQQYVWEIPEGTPLPEGLHLSRARNFETADPDISCAYTLGISSPMELNDLSDAFQSMLIKYGQASPLGAWLSLPENNITECYGRSYSKELVAKWGVPPKNLTDFVDDDEVRADEDVACR